MRFAFFSPQAKLKNINFITDIPKITINADPVLFERLISNLVSNAVEYGLPKTDISLRVHRTNTEEICLSLSNYAELTEEVLEHAFDRLYQGKTARTDTHSGLGLSIVQAIVKSHRWSIDMQYDEKEKKVTFCIIFI
ncbi:MAG: sensor histidine kinase [Treponema sp.]|nr:sensor histidine kinase [Treponema sp.]